MASDKYYLERLARIQRETQGECEKILANRFLEEFGKERKEDEPEYISNMRSYYRDLSEKGEPTGNIDYSFMERLQNKSK